MLSLGEVLGDLSQHRPLFHSEADFQHSLAWELHARLPGADVRLERPLNRHGRNLHVDIWIADGHCTMALELKYKTRRLNLESNQEQYRLKDQSAQDIARYDFLNDVRRLEWILAADDTAVGFAVMLT